MSINDPQLTAGLWDRPTDFAMEQELIDASARVLTVHGELDIATVDRFRDRLDAAVDAGVRRLVLDLSDVPFMDSVAMATILHVRTRLGDGGRVVVALPPDSYARLVFEIAGLPRCLELLETREEAVAAVR